MLSTVKRFAAFCFSCCFCLGCSRTQHDDPAGQVGAKVAVLHGEWVEVHALAKDQLRGKGDYYVWVFTEDRVTWRLDNTIDGKLIDAKILGTGTYKIDETVTPTTMDIDWGKGTGPCIYELDGDTLKLNTGGTERPATFEDGEIYVLKRRRKK
jgi:uncharacterized protein (TIGR03067 family)